MTALTGKATVSEILAENNIVLDDNQKTIPDLSEKYLQVKVFKLLINHIMKFK